MPKCAALLSKPTFAAWSDFLDGRRRRWTRDRCWRRRRRTTWRRRRRFCRSFRDSHVDSDFRSWKRRCSFTFVGKKLGPVWPGRQRGGDESQGAGDGGGRVEVPVVQDDVGVVGPGAVEVDLVEAEGEGGEVDGGGAQRLLAERLVLEVHHLLAVPDIANNGFYVYYINLFSPISKPGIHRVRREADGEEDGDEADQPQGDLLQVEAASKLID